MGMRFNFVIKQPLQRKIIDQDYELINTITSVIGCVEVELDR